MNDRAFDFAIYWHDLRDMSRAEFERLAFIGKSPMDNRALVLVRGVPDHQLVELLDKYQNAAATGEWGMYTIRVHRIVTSADLTGYLKGSHDESE